MRLSTAKYLHIVRASALYDLAITALFITPWAFPFVIGTISSLNQCLGGAALPTFSPLHMLFAGLMASGVLVWSILRLRQPCVAYGRYDAFARVTYAAWMVWALTVTGAPVLWLFLLPELLWAALQTLPVTHTQLNLKGSRLSML